MEDLQIDTRPCLTEVNKQKKKKKYKQSPNVDRYRSIVRPSTTASPGSRGTPPISLQQRLKEHQQRKRSKHLRKRKTKKKKKKITIKQVYQNLHVVFLHDLLEKTKDSLEYLIGIIPTLHQATQNEFKLTLYHHVSNTKEITLKNAEEKLMAIKTRIKNRMELQRTTFEIEICITAGLYKEELSNIKANMIVCRANSHHRIGKVPNEIYKTYPNAYMIIVPLHGYRPRISSICFLSQISEQEMYMIRTMYHYTKIVQSFQAKTLFLGIHARRSKEKSPPKKLEKSTSLSKIIWEGVSRVTHQLIPHKYAESTHKKDEEHQIGIAVEAPPTIVSSPTNLEKIEIPSRPSTMHGTRSPSILKRRSPMIEPPPFTSPLLDIDTTIEFKYRNYDSLPPIVRFAQSIPADMITLVRHVPVNNTEAIIDKIMHSKTSGYFKIATHFPILILPGYM
mmetsp:Transcript_13957/g.21121  ORF Transcript_13957/g.21121 Transcript_13957/m.21121 type:complete len:449 (+) Transcript_13957:48-1394(+)